MSFSESCCCTHRCAMTTISTTTASSSSSSRGRVFHRRTHQSRRRLLRTTEVVQAQTSSSNDAMEEETFDVVIIGSGIGGLSAAALLAKYDLKVCCVESHEHAGGRQTRVRWCSWSWVAMRGSSKARKVRFVNLSPVLNHGFT